MADRLRHIDEVERDQTLERMDDGIDFHFLDDPAQLEDTIPLYWGDLIHMRQYLATVRHLMRDGDTLPEQLLLLKNVSNATLARTVSFGSTFLYHSAADLTALAFSADFARFARGARLIMPRDIVSFASLSALRAPGSASLGLDVTQLICGMPDWRAVFPDGTNTEAAEDGVGLCYFARGDHRLEDIQQVIAIAQSEFGYPLRWLPWGDRMAFPHVGRYEGKLGLQNAGGVAKPKLAALVEALANAKFVITDTYHVAVIAWSVGATVLTIRGDHFAGDFNAVVDKRYIFNIQHSLQDFFVTSAELCQDGQKVRWFAEQVENGTVSNYYRSVVASRASYCENEILSALGD